MAFVFIFRENWKKNLSICNETPKFCDLLVLFCLNVLCNYYVIFFWRDRISPNPCAIFILFWWVKNECLWHSVRTPNRDIEVCRICEPLKTFFKKDWEFTGVKILITQLAISFNGTCCLKLHVVQFSTLGNYTFSRNHFVLRTFYERRKCTSISN